MSEAIPTPLAGRVIAITRPRDRSAPLVAAFTSAGAETILLPVLRLTPVAGEEAQRFEETVRRFVDGGPGWFVLTSASAVAPLAQLLAGDRAFSDRCDGRVRVAAVGEATATAVREHGISSDARPLALVGDGRGAASLAAALLAADPTPRVLHVTSDRGLPTVVDAVRAAGGEAEQTVSVVHSLEPDLAAARLFETPAADAIAFASPSAAEGLTSVCSATEGDRVRALGALAIGETTAAALASLGFTNIATATDPTPEGTVEAAIRLFGER